MSVTESDLVERMAKKHSVSPAAVGVVLKAAFGSLTTAVALKDTAPGVRTPAKRGLDAGKVLNAAKISISD